MNLEAINKWLDEEYGCSYTRLEELHDFYFEKYCDLEKENKQLKDNWNKLKEWLEEMINEIKTNDIYDRTEYECTQIATLENVLAKLEEIGGGING